MKRREEERREGEKKMSSERELERRREANVIGEKMRRKSYYVKESDNREVL
jgi:hypothetical protein